jgi:periplasmic copper chaperone A
MDTAFKGSRRLANGMALALLALALFSGGLHVNQAGAHDYRVSNLSIDHPWTRETPGGAKVAGGYLTITNTGKTADRLVSASTQFAGRVEIHEMAMDGAVMRMREVAGGLEIQPGKTVALKPGGLHLMFMDLKTPLKKGQKAPVTLVFQRAGKVNVSFQVEELGATKPAKGAPTGHQHH